MVAPKAPPNLQSRRRRRTVNAQRQTNDAMCRLCLVIAAVLALPLILFGAPGNVSDPMMRSKFHNLVEKYEVKGYGPTHPRAAFILVATPDLSDPIDSMTKSISSILSHTDRNRILTICAVFQNGVLSNAQKDTIQAHLDELDAGTSVHWHGLTKHSHASSQSDHEHGHKIKVMHVDHKSVSRSRRDAANFVEYLVKNHETADLKSPQEHILTVFVRPDSEIETDHWIDTVTHSIMSSDSPKEDIHVPMANAISFAASTTNTFVDGETKSVNLALKPVKSHASSATRFMTHDNSYPTPIVEGSVTAMALKTYLDLPIADETLDSHFASDLEMSWNLWMCADGIDTVSFLHAKTSLGTLQHKDKAGMSMNSMVRLAHTWMDGKEEEVGRQVLQLAQKAGYNPELDTESDGGDAHGNSDGNESSSLLDYLPIRASKCRSFEWYMKEVNTAMKKELDQLPSIPKEDDEYYKLGEEPPEILKEIEEEEKKRKEVEERNKKARMDRRIKDRTYRRKQNHDERPDRIKKFDEETIKELLKKRGVNIDSKVGEKDMVDDKVEEGSDEDKDMNDMEDGADGDKDMNDMEEGADGDKDMNDMEDDEAKVTNDPEHAEAKADKVIITRQTPMEPLSALNKEIISTAKFVDLEYVDVTGGFADDPHRGALDENGQFGYVHDALVLHNNPPDFEVTDDQAQCNKNDGMKRMLTKKVFVDHAAHEAAERFAENGGKPRAKIFCLVYTIQANHERIPPIQQTWGKKCDGFMVGSDLTDRELGTVNIPHEGPEEYGNIWQKVRSMWSYIYDNYYEDYDWFHIGGDDLYLIVENLRLYLESEEIQLAANGGEFLPGDGEVVKKQLPLFLGRRFKEGGNAQRIFNSGGSGYTMNKAALKALIVDAFPNCMPHLKTFAEDVMVAQCFRNKLNVFPFDTKDDKGGERYMPFGPIHHLNYQLPKDPSTDWYAQYSIDIKFGLDHCAARSVAFHYIKGDAMKRMHALLYGHCDQ